MSDVPSGARERLALIEMPDRIKRLPRDHRGYPVPKFVTIIDGKPDFRVADARHVLRCMHGACWICGEPRGRHLTYAIGPMCTVNRLSSEPPSHLACARYAVQVCPFLAVPEMRRIDTNMPEGYVPAPGIPLLRNPGVGALWTTRQFRPFRHGDGVLFDVGEPVGVEWWCRGRAATLAEVEAAIESGLPALSEVAQAEGEAALKALAEQLLIAQQYLPNPQGSQI